VSALAVAAILFVCVFGGALLGMLLRAKLPKHHLEDESKDVVKLGMGLVATMAALVLGLLVASAKSSYDSQKNGLDQMSASLVILDSALAEYGPEAQEPRAMLRRLVASTLARIWPEDATETSTLGGSETTTGGRALYGRIQRLSPQNDMQRALQTQALRILADLAEARWLLVAQRESGVIPTPFLLVLTFWLVVLFASFGLLGPPNGTVIASLLVSALSVSGAVFLILELSEPFEGLLRISSLPLRNAFAQLGQ
jgi:Protein of unknown function (DUF4239)